MSIIDIIKERKSVRSYNGEQLSADHINKLRNYIEDLSVPFGAKARVELVGRSLGEEPIKLGTYGVINGANYFLVLIVGDDDPMNTIFGGYIFEQTILYCTALGLGTCWLGGTFKQSDFLLQTQLEVGERLTIVSPVGYKKGKRRLLDSIMRVGAGSDNRKPFEELFFKDHFGDPLNRVQAEEYALPLDMIRLAPSASNKQPWRIIKKDNQLHFYHRSNRFSLNDIGIALCHFELVCKESNIQGAFKILDEMHSEKGCEYVITWIAD